MQSEILNLQDNGEQDNLYTRKKDSEESFKLNGASEGTESEPIFVNFVQQVMFNTDVIREVKLFLYA